MLTNNQVLLLFMYEGLEKLPKSVSRGTFENKVKTTFRDWYAKRWGNIEQPTVYAENVADERCIVRIIWAKVITQSKNGFAVHFTNLKGMHYCTIQVSVEREETGEKQAAIPFV